jgi:hypothetical protein
VINGCHILGQIIEGDVIIMFNVFGLETIANNNNNNHGRDDKKELSKRIHFVVCESCFWCASFMSRKSVSLTKCPNCYDNKIQWMPIPKADLDKLNHIPNEGDSVGYYPTIN